METIILQPANDFELLLIKEFIEKTQIKSRVLSSEDSEHYVLSLMIKETDYKEGVEFAEWYKDKSFIREMDEGYEAWKTGKEKGFTLQEIDIEHKRLKKKPK